MFQSNLVKIAAGLAIVFALIAGVRWWQSDERKIRARVKQIQELVDKDRGETNLTSLNKARKISELFADGFEFRAEQFDYIGRDRRSLVGAIHRYRSTSDRVRMRVFDSDLHLDPQAGRATMNLTAEFTADFRGTLGRDGYRFQVNWVKREGQWLIDFVNLVEILAGGTRRWTP